MAGKKIKFQSGTLVQNRKARHFYEIVETLEAGIALRGCEVKSLRAGYGSVAEAYIVPRGEEMYITGMHITPYEKTEASGINPTRERKLLMHRRQIDKLRGQVSQKGMTLVPLKLYLNDKGLVKVEVGLARGKNVADKRQDIKERTVKRELQRDYKLR
jgi:SsrA-binding protein